MKFQKQKLSASGEDMGGSILFTRRIGFSGTPSDLLPRDLGKCQFEPGSEGAILHTLTDERVVSAFELGNDWNAKRVLDLIATADGGTRYHALIDVGALITGLTNLEVAKWLVEGDPDVKKQEDGRCRLKDVEVQLASPRAAPATDASLIDTITDWRHHWLATLRDDATLIGA